MGIGRSLTPKAFVNACEVFVYTETLNPEESHEPSRIDLDSPDWTETVARAIEMATEDDGWAFLGTVGSIVRQLDPAFDSHSYGHKQLSQLIKSRPSQFSVWEENPGRGPTEMYVSLKS